MTLLQEIQHDAVSSDVPLATVLRKCKILASRLGHQAFKNWVEQELNGYNGSELPEYRRVPADSLGTFTNGHMKLSNAPITTYGISKEIADWMKEATFGQGVGELESLVDGNGNWISSPWPSNLLPLLNGRVFEGCQCLQAERRISVSSVRGILDTVRNKVLSFALEIETEAPDAGSSPTRPESPPVPLEKVSQVFNTYITGSGNNVAAASHAFTQSQSHGIGANDWESLRNWVQSIGATEADIKELKEAIASDPPPVESGKFGPRVAGWMGKMVTAAASGALKIGTSAAGGLLARALAGYYGIG